MYADSSERLLIRLRLGTAGAPHKTFGPSARFLIQEQTAVQETETRLKDIDAKNN